MAAAQGKVFYLRDGNVVTFRVEGRGTMFQGEPFRRAAERLLAEGVNQVRVDLRHCQHMDSTFIGTLLSINKGLGRQQSGPLVVLSPSPECGKILHQMGLVGMIPTSADEAPQGAWQEIDCSNPDLPAMKRNATEAHENLAELPGPAGKQFDAVMRCITNAQPAPPKSE